MIDCSQNEMKLISTFILFQYSSMFLTRAGIGRLQLGFSYRAYSWTPQVAVVGGGPAGFYTAQQILKVCYRSQFCGLLVSRILIQMVCFMTSHCDFSCEYYLLLFMLACHFVQLNEKPNEKRRNQASACMSVS